MKILTIVLGVLLGLSLLANGTLAWLWINLAVSLDGSEVANRDCGTHRDSLDAVLRRVAHRRDIKEADSSQGLVSIRFGRALHRVNVRS